MLVKIDIRKYSHTSPYEIPMDPMWYHDIMTPIKWGSFNGALVSGFRVNRQAVSRGSGIDRLGGAESIEISGKKPADSQTAAVFSCTPWTFDIDTNKNTQKIWFGRCITFQKWIVYLVLVSMFIFQGCKFRIEHVISKQLQDMRMTTPTCFASDHAHQRVESFDRS